MNHPDELLAEYVDETLSSPQHDEVARHVAECRRCRDEVALAGASRAALIALPQVVTPTGIGDAAIAEAERSTSAREPSVRPLRRRRGADAYPVWYRWAGVAATAAAVLLASVVVLPRLGDGQQGSTVTADGAERASAPSPATALEIQDANYDTAAVQAIALSYRASADVDPGAEAPEMAATNAASAVAGASSTLEPERTDEALSCILTAYPAAPGVPVRLIQARYGGTHAYLGVFLSGPGAGQASDTVTIVVAAKDGCTVLTTTQGELQP